MSGCGGARILTLITCAGSGGDPGLRSGSSLLAGRDLVMDQRAAGPSSTPAVILYLVSRPLYSSAVELSFLDICFIHVQITLLYIYV